MEGVLDRKALRHLDNFYLVLVASAQDTVLPELCEVFGPELVLGLLEKFGGCTIKIPDAVLLESGVLKVSLYHDLKSVRRSVPEEVSAVARRYQVSPKAALKAYRDVRELIEKTDPRRR